jgi:hypothetical protein
MSRISSDAILDKPKNRLRGRALPTLLCILGPFKVHHALCDWGASMNILPKMVYDCLDEDISHLVFKPKPNAHSMCADESSLHTYCIENGYRITNVTIYNIFIE